MWTYLKQRCSVPPLEKLRTTNSSFTKELGNGYEGPRTCYRVRTSHPGPQRRCWLRKGKEVSAFRATPKCEGAEPDRPLQPQLAPGETATALPQSPGRHSKHAGTSYSTPRIVLFHTRGKLVATSTLLPCFRKVNEPKVPYYGTKVILVAPELLAAIKIRPPASRLASSPLIAIPIQR